MTVNLVNCQSGAVLATDITDAGGFYLFENLVAGTYCVQFDLSNVPANTCAFGAPQFTVPNQGVDDAKDSDANPSNGVTPGVSLLAGQTNRTVDAGIVCPECEGKIGDRAWVDTNGMAARTPMSLALRV